MDALTSVSSAWIWIAVAVIGVLWALWNHFFGPPRRSRAVLVEDGADAQIERMRLRYAFWGSEMGCTLALAIIVAVLAVVLLVVMLIYELAK